MPGEVLAPRSTSPVLQTGETLKSKTSALSSPSSTPSSPTSLLGFGFNIIAEFLSSNSEQAAVEKARSAAPPPPARKDGKLTMEHVAAHHRDGDAWVAIKGKVKKKEERLVFFFCLSIFSFLPARERGSRGPFPAFE